MVQRLPAGGVETDEMRWIINFMKAGLQMMEELFNTFNWSNTKTKQIKNGRCAGRPSPNILTLGRKCKSRLNEWSWVGSCRSQLSMFTCWMPAYSSIWWMIIKIWTWYDYTLNVWYCTRISLTDCHFFSFPINNNYMSVIRPLIMFSMFMLSH